MLAGLLLTGILLLPGAASSGKSAPATLSPALAPRTGGTTISNPAVSPSAILFLASDPTNKPVDAALQTVVVTWTTSGSTLGSAWNLQVSAPSTFTPCPWIPVSAVTVSCSAVSGGTGGTCGGSTAMSTSVAQVASGTETAATTNYSVTLNYTLNDSWKYVASSCFINVTYTINAN